MITASFFIPNSGKKSGKHIRIIMYSQRSLLKMYIETSEFSSKKKMFSKMCFFFHVYMYHPSFRVYFIGVGNYVFFSHRISEISATSEENRKTIQSDVVNRFELLASPSAIEYSTLQVSYLCFVCIFVPVTWKQHYNVRPVQFYDWLTFPMNVSFHLRHQPWYQGVHARCEICQLCITKVNIAFRG